MVRLAGIPTSLSRVLRASHNTMSAVFCCLLLTALTSGCISPAKTELEGGLASGSLLGTTIRTATLVIDSAPDLVTSATGATFSFTANPTSSTTKCSLDGAAATACTSPMIYAGLADGLHVFVVTVEDGGTTLATATHVWTVDTIAPGAPAASLTSSTPTNNTGATMTIASCTDRSHIFVNETATAPAAGAAGWQTCSTTASAITHTMAGTATHTLNVWAKDAAGNVSATSTDLTVALDVTNPTITLNSLTGGQTLKSGATVAITWTAADAVNLAANPISIDVSTNSGTSWTSVATGEANDSTYTWNIPAATDSATYRVRVTAADAVTNTASAASTSDFIIDNTAPVFTAGQMTLNAGAPTASNSYVQVTLQAIDNLTNITHFCLRSNNTTVPLAADACWNSVTASPPGLALSTTLNLANYPFLVGTAVGVYTVYAWAKDAVGNISGLTNAAAGTAAQDKDDISYAPGASPVIVDILVADSGAPANPPASGELRFDPAVDADNDVHIKWKATDDQAFPAGPITLYYTTNDTTFTQIATGLNNGSNAGCTVNDGGTTADDTATGCYVWTNGAPTVNYFKIRIAATDASGGVTFASSTALNVWPPINFLAGNTEPGLGATATAAIFFNNTNQSSIGDPHSFVVKADGTIFFRDINRGILKVDPSTNIQSIYIAKTGASTGDTGQATSATLTEPTYIALDYSERLLIFDSNRIRRVEANGTIDTIIGGGGLTTDTVAPLSLSIAAQSYNGTGSYYGEFFALPNGNIHFPAVGTSNPGRPSRYYDVSSNLVKSFYLTGTGDSINGATVQSDCGYMNFAVEFNPATSAIAGGIADNWHSGIGGAGCTAGGISGVAFNGTGVATAPHPVQNYLFLRVQGRDGKIYGVNRFYGQISRYSSTTRTWTTLVGTGTQGSCIDGTAATSCKIDPQDVFVTANSRIYFVDRGRIRYVDDSGNVVTIAGQSFSYGDGGNALSARFGKINDISLWDDAGTDKVIVLDQAEIRLRELSIDGNIATIAGDGSNGVPNTVAAANAQAITISGSGVYFDYFTNDASGNVFLGDTYSIKKLNRGTGLWTSLVGGGATDYMTADGLAGNLINLSFGYYGVALGYDGTNILSVKSHYSGGHVDALMKLYTVANGTQSSLAGVTGAATGNYCAVGGGGTALTACAVPFSYGEAHLDPHYDSVGTRWLASTIGSTSVRILDPGGNMAQLVSVTNGMGSFTYRRIADAPNPDIEMIYYCATGDGRLYKYNVNTATNTALDWPVASMSCTGRAMTYSASRNSLLFIYKQNNLYGVAEYINP